MWGVIGMVRADVTSSIHSARSREAFVATTGDEFRGGPPLAPADELVDGPAGADQEALSGVAAEISQPLLRRLVLDPFGDHPQAQLVTQADDGLHDDRVTFLFEHLTDEGAIDLDLIDGQLPQVRQR